MYAVASIAAFVAVLGASHVQAAGGNVYQTGLAADDSRVHAGNRYKCQDGKFPDPAPEINFYLDNNCTDRAWQLLGDIFEDCDGELERNHYYADNYAFDSCCQLRGDVYINNGISSPPACEVTTPR